MCHRMLCCCLLVLAVFSDSRLAWGGAPPAPAPPTAPVAVAATPLTAADVQKIVNDTAARVRAAQDHRSRAGAAANLLTQNLELSADETSVQRLEALAASAKEITAQNLPAALDTDKNSLNVSDNDLGKLRAPQTGDSEDLSAALAAAQTQKSAVTEALSGVNTAANSLTEARSRVITAAGTLFDAWDARLKPLNDLSGDVPALLVVLPSHVADLTAAQTVRGRISAAWTPLKKSLADPGWNPAPVAAGAKGPLDTAQDKLDALNSDVKKFGSSLDTWLKRLMKNAQDQTGQTVAKWPLVISDPAGNTESAKKLKTDAQREADAVSLTAAAAGDFLGAIHGDSDFNTLSAALASDLQSLQEANQTLLSSLSHLQEALGGDRSDWVAEPVSLFYFDDVRRLMTVLNPTTQEKGGAGDLKAKAATAQAELSRAEASLSDAQAQVNTFQNRLGGMKETLRAAQARFKTDDGASQIFKQRLLDAQRLQTKESDKYTRAQTALSNDPNNPLKQAAEQSAERAKDSAGLTVTDAQNRSTDADSDRAKSQDALEQLKNENDSLPAAITLAHGQLETAQQAVVLQRRLALTAAQDVTQAFADARDNAPYFEADADAASTDPARRVEMYAFNDSKTIFLRGKREDVTAVKALIAKFDQPVPQARLTLWTLELDSAAGKDAARKFDLALQTVEDNLSGKRTQIAASLSLLRDAINQEVRRVSQSPPVGFVTRFGFADSYEARLAFYADDFYKIRPILRARQIDLPDPAGTTTLGEALVVLSMARRESKEKILKTFDDSLHQQGSKMLGKLEDYKNTNDQNYRNLTAEQKAAFGFPDTVWFAALRRALGCPQSGSAEVPGIVSDPCPAQIEILRALKRKAWERVVSRFENLGKALEDTSQQSTRRFSELEILKNSPQATAAQKDVKAQQIQSLWAERDDIIDNQFIPLLNALPQTKRLQEIEKSFFARDNTPEAVYSNAAKILAASDEFRDQYATDSANARVAAADQMLKEMIIAMEDDLDRHFVMPMLRKLTSDLRKQGIQVGVLNRTSVLASNRLIARVDPRGTGQLAVGEEQNALEDAQQLASLAVATQTAGLSGLAGLSGALGGLNSLPRDAPPALYGVTQGSVFQVTPVIDPSGQALRFRFDYVASTQVQEPDGKLDPQLPRIEHHAVNTEVQLSNMELRNISQFDGNVKLGITPRKEGGIPILKDIPLLSDLPLIGWFSKRKGQAALTQQSLIFAQTTIYPTINDLIPLLAGDFQAGGFQEGALQAQP